MTNKISVEMAEAETNQGVSIPQDAVEVQVTNIINPYFMRISEVLDDRVEKNNLDIDLLKLYKKILKYKNRELNRDYVPKIGDHVLIHNNGKKDLPMMVCRAIVTDVGSDTSDVFLLDYGIAMNMPIKCITKCSRKCTLKKPFTSTVGIYNILPIDPDFCILNTWPNHTIDFIKDLIRNSKKIYYEVLSCDKKTNRIYGDFYLVIEDENICLSQALIDCNLAIPLYKELLKVIKNGIIEDKILVPYESKEGQIITNGEVAKTDNVNNNNRRPFIKKKETIEKLLIRSKFMINPLEHIEDSRFSSLIHRALKERGVRAPKNIQSYVWPAIKQEFDVAVISSTGSGKTLGYIVPILNSIVHNEEIIFEKQKQGTASKPVALILCASVNKCVDITAKCKEVLTYHKKIKSFAAFNGLPEKQILTSIYNKFQILVITPPFLIRLLRKYPTKLSVSNLCYLVLDNADILLTKYYPEFMTLIKDYKIINKDIEHSILCRPMQIVVSAKTWTDRIHSIVDRYMKDPYVCIGTFTEAAAFCKVQGRMLIRHSDKKKYEVLGALGDCAKVKTMILCLNTEEAIELNKFLVSNSIETLLVHEELTSHKIDEVRDDWTKCLPGMYPVIICTDQVLTEIGISNIEFLINYTVTNTSKTQFDKRFSIFMDIWQQELKTKCKVLILFDETKENVHFKGMINILKRLKVELPGDWNQIADGLDLANNLKKKNYPLCDSIKCFGVCENHNCPYRHRIIAEVDGPSTDITIGDQLKLHITYLQSATHFIARVIEYRRECSKTGKMLVTTLPCDVLKLNMEMKKHYSKSANRKMPKNIHVGKCYALRNSDNTYSRVQILNITQRDSLTDKPSFMRGQSIDDGKLHERINAHSLYELPEELLKFQFPIVNIFLTNIAPFDDEYKWTDLANQNVSNWFQTNCNGVSSFVFAKVLLHIGNSIWTDSLVVKTKIINLPDVVSAALNDTITQQGHGTVTTKHLANILQLCHSGGLTEINGRPIPFENKDEKNVSIDECD